MEILIRYPTRVYKFPNIIIYLVVSNDIVEHPNLIYGHHQRVLKYLAVFFSPSVNIKTIISTVLDESRSMELFDWNNVSI